ncbi:hypothetical protein FDP08_03595 [Marinobacter panjinensis]|uniref:Uncharacterized protein n=1 Tax=Marinobacter panjinensis TaxID=2576384 RepID=A0A4V6CU71_9GAMM|nr:hypothetical protein [Marinobacter panjinensis]MCR8915784.1 hypothetical protein [Marinobacter panjinensis]TKV67235.1 hypothetical protein FDP08_03595 [Marinobacter panjinensis]
MTSALNMPEILCQQALERVLAYLGDDGVVLTADTCRQALRLVESALAENASPDLPARCVASIPDYFELPCESIPKASPPLKRGCIGYD